MPAPVAAPVLPTFVAASVLPIVAAVSATSFSLDELAPLPAFVEAPVTPENDTAEDLERLFAIRDRELEQLAINNLLPVGYEKTEPAPL